MIIRPAEPSDLREIVRMGMAFYEHVKFDDMGLRFDLDDFMDLSLQLIESQDGCFLLGERDGRVAGGIAGELHLWGFCKDQRVAIERWWWIDPDARGTRLAFRLVDGYTDWAKERGAEQVFLACMDGTGNAEKLDRIYRRMGFRLLEHHYCKGVIDASNK